MIMVILRSGVCFTSLYIKDSNYADAVGACRKLLGTVRTEFRNAAKWYDETYKTGRLRLIVGCDANVEVTANLPGVTGSAVCGR